METHNELSDINSESSTPITLFKKWFSFAKQNASHNPESMALATVDLQGKPSSRFVLLKNVDEKGFVFYTNYQSIKARHFKGNQYVALLFYWSELNRQVRIEGTIEKISPTESDLYFKTRPRGKQIGAWASQQSMAIESRNVLENKVDFYTEKFKDQDIPRPPF